MCVITHAQTEEAGLPGASSCHDLFIAVAVNAADEVKLDAID